ncbi:Hypothetical protein EHI5A_249300 [Entamoeba histolytica KU27]|uniref:AIG1 family protein n=2 Tax=Entamoeba histolytica TaxID=5759 RepID=M2SFC3_ENTHI|nr:Hypothetical protein EHI5A_249300 [Entamoeba histolytica KU27]
MDFNSCKFSETIQQVIKIINDVFTIKDIWKHICIVWTRCYNYIPPKKIEKGKIEKEQFKEELISFINQINKTNEEFDIPMYYVDSQPDEDYDNSRSEDEIERLIEWGRGLKLIDKEEINKLVSEYKEIRYEEKPEKGKIIKETGSSITYEINTYERCVKVKYNGEEIKGEHYLISSRIVTENKSKQEDKKESKKWGCWKKGIVIILAVGGGIALFAAGAVAVGVAPAIVKAGVVALGGAGKVAIGGAVGAAAAACLMPNEGSSSD